MIMTEQKIRKIKLAYGIGMSALTVIVGALFILQVWSIFFSAEQSPFTPAIIGEKFLQILAPICLWALAIIGGGVLGMIYPDEKKTLKGYIEPRKTLALLKSRLPQSEGGMSALKRENILRIVVWCAAGGACVTALIATVTLLLDTQYVPLLEGAFFVDHGGVVDRLIRIALYSSTAFLTCLMAVLMDDYVVKHETQLVKARIAENAKQGVKPIKAERKPTLFESIVAKYPVLRSERWKQGVQIGLCALGVTFVIIGIVNGGMMDVFEKARNICTQCIGLG